MRDNPSFESNDRKKAASETAKRQVEGIELSLQSAEDVVRRSNRQLQAPPGTRPADVRSRLARINRVTQSQDLITWANENEFLISPHSFTQKWRDQGSVAGQECEVFYEEESGRYFKRNSGIAYEDWVQFFASVRIHNQLFPDTAYRLEGISEIEERVFVILSQSAVLSTMGATRRQVELYMARFGFVHAGNDHYESESLLIQDLHDENVLIGPGGNLYFIDTCIYLKPGKTFKIT
jgi:hypothetical protein